MNKKEVQEIKKAFSGECDFLTINNVLKVCVNNNSVLHSSKGLFGTLPVDDQEVLLTTFTKSVGGTFGKHLREYSFSKEGYNEGGTLQILRNACKAKLTNDESCTRLVDAIVKNCSYTNPYAIFIASCTYNLNVKNKNDEDTDMYSEYNFIITSMCPLEFPEDTLMYDDDKNKIYKRPKNKMLIKKAPTDAFVFPVLTQGEPDVNGVLYYTSKPKEPNFSIINNILNCETVLPANAEKASFNQVLEDGIGDDLSLPIISAINEEIAKEIAKHSSDEKPAEIDSDVFERILESAGVNEENVDTAVKCFENTIGDNKLLATNVVDPKTVIKIANVTVTVPKDSSDIVHLSRVGGKQCLVIDIDSENVIINEMDVTV